MRKLVRSLDDEFANAKLKVGRDTLFNVLRKHQMLTLRKRTNARTTNSYHRFYKYSNIIKDLEVTRPNQLWVSDITYIRTVKGFCYLALITDMHSIECYPNWNDGYEGCWTWGEDLAKTDIHLLEGHKKKSGWKVYRKSYAKTNNGEKAQKKLFTILQDSRFYTEKGQAIFGEIFPGLNKNDFPQPKSVDFVKELINTITDKESIILDSFAGSGTTAHAVLNLNREDSGNRKFICVEMEDYANDITAERVKRVIKGYGEGSKSVEGTSGDFSFYELGKPLFLVNDLLNEEVGIDKIEEYVWYSETKSPFIKQTEQYLLGEKNNSTYYFYYDKEAITTLDESFLRRIKTKAQQYIIYADNCLLSKDIMDKYNIVFKKIPRDITRF